MHGDIKGTGSQKRNLERGGWGSFVKCLFTYMKGSDSEDEKSSLKTGIVLGEKLAGIEACRGQFQEREGERERERELLEKGWSHQGGLSSVLLWATFCTLPLPDSPTTNTCSSKARTSCT